MLNAPIICDPAGAASTATEQRPHSVHPSARPGPGRVRRRAARSRFSLPGTDDARARPRAVGSVDSPAPRVRAPGSAVAPDFSGVVRARFRRGRAAVPQQQPIMHKMPSLYPSGSTNN